MPGKSSFQPCAVGYTAHCGLQKLMAKWSKRFKIRVIIWRNAATVQAAITLNCFDTIAYVPGTF